MAPAIPAAALAPRRRQVPPIEVPRSVAASSSWELQMKSGKKPVQGGILFPSLQVANPVSGKWDLLRAFDARGQADNRRRRIFDTFFNPADRSCNQLPVAL